MAESEGEGGTVSRDNFYRGVIKRLYHGAEAGIVRSLSGREVPFTFLHVSMVGPLRRFEDLHEGMPVGFDVGWTSSGLRVTVLAAG
jgi:hypothetical protein